MPAALATFDPEEAVIRVESIKSEYVGLNWIRIVYTMQDYLAEQEPLITEFTLSVEPPPALVEFECTRACTFPTFNVDTLEGTLFEIEVGEGWEFTLPKPAPHTLGYDVWYETVELNGANLFATYVKEWSKIIIQADKTTEANIGDYSIWLRLVDEAGKFSQLLTIQLSITGEL